MEVLGIQKSQGKQYEDILIQMPRRMPRISQWRKIYLESFKFFLDLVVANDKREETEVRRANFVRVKAPPPAVKSTPDLRKRQHEPWQCHLCVEKEKSPGLIIFRGLWAVWHFGRQSPKRKPQEATRKAKQAKWKSAVARQRVPIDNGPEV